MNRNVFIGLLVMTAGMGVALPIQAQTEEYDLKIVDKKVTSDNAGDILGNGAVSYEASTKTLTISGDIHDDKALGIDCKIPGLTIYVANDVTVYTFINFYSDATITGSGKLSIIASADCALYVEFATLTIKDANIDASGGWGIAGYPQNEHLIIDNSYVHATGWKGAVCDFTSITLNNSSISQPEGGYVDGGDIMDSNGYEAEEVTIVTQEDIITGSLYNDAYWATYYNSMVARVADTNTTVYTATLSDDQTYLTLKVVADGIIPAGQAVILKSSTESIVLSNTSENGGDYSGNSLSGCDWQTAVPTDQGTIYTMDVKNGTLGFFRYEGEKLNSHKAYLAIMSSEAPIRIGFNEGEATGIETTNLTNDTNKDRIWYDLSGRELNGTTRNGMYIVNGKKIIIRNH